MFESALSDANFVLFALMCIVLIAIVTALYRARRAEIVRLQGLERRYHSIIRLLEMVDLCKQKSRRLTCKRALRIGRSSSPMWSHDNCSKKDHL
jgi:hypothetical protein